MNLLSKRVLQLAAGLLVLGVLILATPQAARTAAAALVQVTNTTASPVISQDLTTYAANMVVLTTPYSALINPSNGTVNMHLMHPETGYDSDDYVVPAGYKLVITEVDIMTEEGNFGGYLRYAISGATTASEYLYVAHPGTQQFRYRSGAVYGAGKNVKFECLKAGTGLVNIHGYLTKN